MKKELNQEKFSKIIGRPKKYETEEIRKEVRRNQNRINQIACRNRKRIKMLEHKFLGIFNKQKQTNKNSNKIYHVKNNKLNYNYREELMNFFGKFEFDTLFTATLNPSNKKKNEVKNSINQIDYQTQLHEHVFNGNTLQKMGMNLFIKKTKEYVDKLANMKLFERCFGVFELGKNNQIHVHILFKKTELIRGFNTLLKNNWKIGISNTQNIKKREKNTTVSYCLKELKALSSKKRDMLIIDSWFFEGNFKSGNN